MIRIAYVIHKPRIGGAELHLLEVLKRLDRRRFDPLIVFLGHGDTEPLYQQYLETGVEILSLGMPEGILRWQNLKQLRLLARTLRGKGTDIVHGYLLEGNFVASVVGLIAGVKYRICSKRSLEHHSRTHLNAAWLSNSLSTRVTTVSKAVGQFTHDVEGCPWDKIVVIPNGVHPRNESADARSLDDLRRRWSIPPGAFIVGTVARFGWKKGYEHFVRAAEKVVREAPEVHFVGLGDGPLKKEIEVLVRETGISDKVSLPGWESNVRPKLALFDLYISTSIIEGMSNALLEAMAERRPVVATAVGGNCENVVDEVTGFLVPPGDPAALAKRILELVRRPALAQRMGQAGRARMLEHYSVERMVTRMEDLYTSLCERTARLQQSEDMLP